MYTADNIAVVFGDRADKYMPAYTYLEENNKKVCWNWSAFLLTPAWLFYRKIYSIFFIWIFVSFTTGAMIMTFPVLALILDNAFLVQLYRISVWFQAVFLTASSLLLGLFGTHIYIRRTKNSRRIVKPPSKSRIIGAIAILAGCGFVQAVLSTFIVAFARGTLM